MGWNNCWIGPFPHKVVSSAYIGPIIVFHWAVHVPQVSYWQQTRLIYNTMALPPKWYQFLVSVFASLGSLLYGYDLGVIAEVIASGSFKAKFGDNPKEVYVNITD